MTEFAGKIIILPAAIYDGGRAENLQKSFPGAIIRRARFLDNNKIVVGSIIDLDFDGSLDSIIRGGVEDSVGDESAFAEKMANMGGAW